VVIGVAPTCGRESLARRASNDHIRGRQDGLRIKFSQLHGMGEVAVVGVYRRSPAVESSDNLKPCMRKAE